MNSELRELTDFFENAAIALHWVGPDGTILRANRAELELLGYAHDEYVGRNIAEFHVDRPVIEQLLRRLSAGETVRNYQARLRCKDGSVRDVLISSNVQWLDGKFAHTRCFTQDISERKRVESLRTETTDYLEGLMEGFVAYDGDWRMTYMNAAGERILGRRREDVLGKTWHQAFPHAVGNPVDQMYQRVMRTRAGERMEYFYPHYDRWLEISASPVRTGGVGVYFRDISDRKRAEQAALEERRVYRAIGESIDYGIWICDREGRNLYASESFLALVGLTQEQCSQFGWGEVLHPDDAERTIAAWKECVRSGGTWDIQHRFRGVDGKWHPILARGVPVRDEHGEVSCWAGINLDIGRLKQVEEQLRDADRRKDEFLATLAHELRNPLAPIRSGLQVLQVSKPGSEPFRQAQLIMERQLAHLVRLLDDLMEVSRITQGRLTLQKQVVDLAEPVRTALDASRPLIAAGRHELALDLPREPVRVHADPVRLAQVVSNLLNNAAKYTPDGGRISLSVRREGAAAQIRVRDSGIGIAPEMLPRLFEKFAQLPGALARSHGGLGIGLSLARTLVELHGGTIQAMSEGEGKGAEFVVSLPASAASPSQEAAR